MTAKSLFILFIVFSYLLFAFFIQPSVKQTQNFVFLMSSWTEVCLCYWLKWPHNLFVPLGPVHLLSEAGYQIYKVQNVVCWICIISMLWAMHCLGLRAPLRIPPIFNSVCPLRKSDPLKTITAYILIARDTKRQVSANYFEFSPNRLSEKFLVRM